MEVYYHFGPQKGCVRPHKECTAVHHHVKRVKNVSDGAKLHPLSVLDHVLSIENEFEAK